MSTEKKETPSEKTEAPFTETTEELFDQIFGQTPEEKPAEEAPKKEKKPKKESARTPKKDEAKYEEEKKEAVRTAVERAVAEEKEKYLRLAAEYDNFRRRTQKEKSAMVADVRSDTLIEFLPVYDNLERALRQETADEFFRRGVEMIMAQFTATMEKLGVTEIEALGETFDPEKHNAVFHVEDEAYGENEVIEVLQKGFRIGDKVIRFAMVKVAN